MNETSKLLKQLNTLQNKIEMRAWETQHAKLGFDQGCYNETDFTEALFAEQIARDEFAKVKASYEEALKKEKEEYEKEQSRPKKYYGVVTETRTFIIEIDAPTSDEAQEILDFIQNNEPPENLINTNSREFIYSKFPKCNNLNVIEQEGDYSYEFGGEVKA